MAHSTAARRSAFRALVLFAVVFHRGESACLTGAIPPEDRVGIPDLAGGGQVPFGLWVMNWDSAKLASHVVKLLAEEVLGYTSRISGVGSSSASGLYATAGCLRPNDFATDPGCGSSPTFIHHATLEVWGLSTPQSMRQRLSAWPEVIPEDAGNIGYEGIQGTYIFTQEKEAAYRAQGMALEYYRSYDASWRQPWQYFDNYTSFDPADLRPCTETRFMDSMEIRKYLNVTGDVGGVVENSDGSMSARCWHGSWWFAPACRSNPERCVPSVTGSNGWFVHDVMQQAATFNMPLALTVGRTNAKWRSIPRQRRCLPYWWQPDSSFIDLKPTILTFPPYNALERSQGIRTSMADNSRLSKWVHNRLGLQAARLRTLLLRVNIPMTSINELLLENKLRSGSAFEEVACSWVRANENIWRPWIPIKTECIPGTGLVGAGGAFVASRAEAKACSWCSPGRHSAEYSDHVGTTHLCLKCPTGYSQPNPGQLECDACRPGSFAQAEESQECRQCDLGRFRNSTAGATCSACGSQMTTRVLGAMDAGDCICPEGMYKPLFQDDCKPCPEGMHCELGSDEAHIPAAGNSTSPGSGAYPRPLPMYYVTGSEPLSVYVCLDESSCPGGEPGECAAKMSGIACGRCADGYYRTMNSGCRECGAFAQSKGFLVGLVFLVGPSLCLILYRVSNDQLLSWTSPSSAIFACLFLTLAYLQVIAVVRMCYFIYPHLIASWTEWTSFVLDIMAPVRAECADISDFELIFTLRLLTPVYSLLIFLATWLVSRALETFVRFLRLSDRATQLCHLDGNVVVGCYGGLYNTFFVGIASQLFALFQCYGHPNGQSSLRSSPEVLCSSDTWEHLLWPTVPSLLLFCGGALTLFAYVSIKAPSLFHDEAFRNRWRFLFTNFRPSVWWWSMLLLLKGLCLNLTTVIFKAAHLQLAWLSLTHTIYLVLCFALLPWRSMGLSALDILMHSMLLLFLSLLPYFVPQTEAIQDDTASLSVFCCCAPLLGTCAVVIAQLRLRIRPTSSTEWQDQAAEFVRVFQRLTDAEEAKLVLEVLPTADLLTLRAAERMLEAEIMGEMAAGDKVSSRLSMRHARSETERKSSTIRRVAQRGVVQTIQRSWEMSAFTSSLQMHIARERAAKPQSAPPYLSV